MGRASGPDAPEGESPAIVLGAALAAAARHGFDKVTYVASPSLEPLGAWLEQLLAESTGKEGRGVVPVEGEPWGEPRDYGPDRIFVAGSLKGEEGPVEAFADRLAAAGHPVLRWQIEEKEGLGAEFFRWEIATAVLGALLEVDPFDEPNVTEAKDTTRELLREWEQSRKLPPLVEVASSNGLSLQTERRGSRHLRSALTALGLDPGDPAAWLAAHISTVAEGDYLALCAYVARTEGRHARLTEMRRKLGVARPVTLGYGPRYLHSTGQLHKGGPNNGVFLQITAGGERDLAIPGAPYGFGVLRDAQALGDLRVLEARDRRALRVYLAQGADAGLTALEATMTRAQELAGRAETLPRRELP